MIFDQAIAKGKNMKIVITEIPIKPETAAHYSGGDTILEAQIKASGVTGWIVQERLPSSKTRPEGGVRAIPSIQDAGMRFASKEAALAKIQKWAGDTEIDIEIVPLEENLRRIAETREAEAAIAPIPRPALGTAIKAAREAAGLSQGDVAERLTAILGRPVLRTEISRWESGGRKPSAANLRLIEQAIGAKIKI